MPARHAWSVPENQSLQCPEWPRTVALADRVGSWWPDLPTQCPACEGRLLVEPPMLLPGAVVCMLCARPVAEVVERLRVVPEMEPLPVRRSQPRLRLPGDTRTRCEVCEWRVARAGRPRCRQCAIPREVLR